MSCLPRALGMQRLMERVRQLLTCATSNRGLQIQGARGTALWNSTCACSTRRMDGLSDVRQPKMQDRNLRTQEELQSCFEWRLQRMLVQLQHIQDRFCHSQGLTSVRRDRIASDNGRVQTHTRGCRINPQEKHRENHVLGSVRLTVQT